MKNILLVILTISVTQIVAGDAADKKQDKDFFSAAIAQAHAAGFKGCDEEIKSVFEIASGTDITVNADWFAQTKGDYVRLTAVWGSMGDSVFQEAEFRKSWGHCFATVTNILTTKQNCTTYLREMSNFKFVYRSLEFIGLENKNRTSMLVKPFNNGCMVIFQGGRK